MSRLSRETEAIEEFLVYVDGKGTMPGTKIVKMELPWKDSYLKFETRAGKDRVTESLSSLKKTRAAEKILSELSYSTSRGDKKWKLDFNLDLASSLVKRRETEILGIRSFRLSVLKRENELPSILCQ